MPRLTITLTLFGLCLLAQFASASESPLFSCYRTLSEHSQNPTLLAGGRAGLEYKTDFSFDVVSAEGVRTCTVPAKALLEAGDPLTAGRYITFAVADETMHLAYGKRTSPVPDYNQMPKDTFTKAICDGVQNDSARWIAILRRQVKEQKPCGGDDQGMSLEAACNNQLVERLKACETAAGGDKILARTLKQLREEAEQFTGQKAGDIAPDIKRSAEKPNGVREQ